MAGICVVGSLNMDLVAVAKHFPQPGETVIGQEFVTYPGGKGANQAVAAGRLAAPVRMIGKVGNDSFGAQQIKNLAGNGVTIDGVGVEAGTSSGIALIEVDSAGENAIVVIPGANARVSQAYIDSQFDYMQECDIFLFQLEIPLETVFYTIKKLKKLGKVIILDPAPARLLPEEIFPYVDFITPNETEIAALSAMNIESEAQLYHAAQCLLHKGAKTVILKAGKNGAYIITHDYASHVPGFAVETIDTTGAGDTFNAGFAVSLGEGLDLKDCVRFANAAGALSTTGKGAQSAMPTLEQVRRLIDRA